MFKPGDIITAARRQALDNALGVRVRVVDMEFAVDRHCVDAIGTFKGFPFLERANIHADIIQNFPIAGNNALDTPKLINARIDAVNGVIHALAVLGTRGVLAARSEADNVLVVTVSIPTTEEYRQRFVLLHVY